MKRFNLNVLLLTALLSVFGLGSCSDDAQPSLEIAAVEDVPADIRADFSRSYPEAADEAWTVSDGYAVVSFTTAEGDDEYGHHSSVWYWLNDSKKKMHSSPLLFSDLPAAVTTAFYAGEYAAFTPARYAHVITRYLDDDTDSIYVIKAAGTLDGAASTAVKLYYTADGMLVKVSSEMISDESSAKNEDLDDVREWLPNAPADFVKTYVDTFYPGARYLYFREGRNFTKVKILDGHAARSIQFDGTGTWVSTATEIDYDEMPSDIIAAFRASDFAEWHLRKVIEYLTAAEGRYYQLSLEKAKNKTEIRISADGTVSDVDRDSSQSGNTGDSSDGAVCLGKGEIEGFILAKYPGASVIKCDYDDDDAEIEIKYEGHKIKVVFELHAQGYVWSQSEWDFDVRDTASLPAAVLKTISEKYSGYRLEYLVYNEAASGADFYEAGLKSSSTKTTVTVKMDLQGAIVAEYGRH